MKLQFLIAASPSAAFCSQIAMFKLGLDHLGPPYSTARLTAIFGDAEITELPADWAPHLQGVEAVFVEPADFVRYNAFAQGDMRFELVDRDADVVLMFDADTLLLRPIPELLAQSLAKPALRGVIAHRSPFNLGGSWEEVGAAFLDAPLELDHHYELEYQKVDGVLRRVSTPFYINQGVMCATPEVFLDLGPKMRALRRAFIERWPEQLMFSSQIALTLAFIKHGIPHEAIPMRYNFANRVREADIQYPDELKQIAVLHYQELSRYDRHKIFTTRDQFDSFLALELEGSHRVFQDHVRLLTGGQYPFS
ncbi:MAG: hypothetical protein ACRBBS_09410 [Thalassovita sp.]